MSSQLWQMERMSLTASLVERILASYACGAAGAFLVDCFPCNGAAAAHDEVAAHGAVLEKFNLFTVWHRAANLAAQLALQKPWISAMGGGWGGISVGLTVVGWRVVKVG